MSKPSTPTPKQMRLPTATLLSLAGGALMACAFPPVDFSNWVWVGLLPLISAVWQGPARFRRGFWCGWCYGFGLYGTSFYWLPNTGLVFGMPLVTFLCVAYIPLIALYACLPGLWGGLAATWLRPRLHQGPDVADEPQEIRRKAWGHWAFEDMISTLRAAVGLGAFWVCIEWFRGQNFWAFNWNSLGLALYDGLSFAQWAEFVGTYALSFIPVATAVILWGSLRRVWMSFKGAGKACRPWDFYGAVILLFLLFTGGLALSKAYSPLVMMKRPGVLQLPVAAVQINLDQSERMERCNYSRFSQAEVYSYMLSLTGSYLNETMAAFNSIQRETVQRAMQNPEVGIIQQLPLWIVWPESAISTPFIIDAQDNKRVKNEPAMNLLEDAEQGLPLLRAKVREMGGRDFVLFTGVDEILYDYAQTRSVGFYNSLACIPGGFDSITSAAKRHLMPFGEYIPLTHEFEFIGDIFTAITDIPVGEGLRAGTSTEPLVVPVPGTTESVQVIPAICFEDSMGGLLREFARKGPQVIVNNTNDAWFGETACGLQQARVAAFRCIELRRPMVRAANHGLCCTIAPNGGFISTLQKADGSPHLAGYSYGVLPVDREAGLTLYALLGDWAVLLCMLLAVGLSIPGLPRFRQS